MIVALSELQGVTAQPITQPWIWRRRYWWRLRERRWQHERSPGGARPSHRTGWHISNIRWLLLGTYWIPQSIHHPISFPSGCQSELRQRQKSNINLSRLPTSVAGWQGHNIQKRRLSALGHLRGGFSSAELFVKANQNAVCGCLSVSVSGC